VPIGNIVSVGYGVTARIDDLLDNIISRGAALVYAGIVDAPIVYDNAGSGRGEGQSVGTTDAAAAAGNHDHLALE
jgi:hypothetical protein